MLSIWKSCVLLFVLRALLFVTYANKNMLTNKIFLTVDNTIVKNFVKLRNSSSEVWYVDIPSMKIAEVAHWLLPSKSREKLPYRGLEDDLDALLKVLAGDEKKVAILKFNRQWQEMIQNNIYTLVHFGLVHHYIVLVGDEVSLLVA